MRAEVTGKLLGGHFDGQLIAVQRLSTGRAQPVIELLYVNSPSMPWMGPEEDLSTAVMMRDIERHFYRLLVDREILAFYLWEPLYARAASTTTPWTKLEAKCPIRGR